MKILAIIPARGGSKGIYKKNLAELCGKPLIAWSIEIGNMLVEESVIDRCIVSSDDKEIIEEAKKNRADIPFVRPGNFSGDKSKAQEYIMHAINFFENKNEFYDAVLILQPTSPQRNLDDLVKIINKFKDSNADSLISCYQEDYICDLVMYNENEMGYLEPLNKHHNKGSLRQEHGPILVRNGAIYLTKINYFKKYRRIISENPMCFKMDKKSSITIDTEEDLEILRAILCK